MILKFAENARCNLLMIINENHVYLIAEKYKLNKNNFAFIEKKNFFKKKFFIIYKPHEFFFELNKKGEDLNNFFPFFSEKKDYNFSNSPIRL